MSTSHRRIQIVLVLYVAFVFVQSLFFKFTNSPETVYIFGTLDEWAGGLGLPGLFAPNGIFSQYVIGSAELVASAALLASLSARFRSLRPYAALLSMGVISGAILFHLFTPLGVSVLNADGTRDGGLLFGMACGVWLASAALIWLNRDRVALPGALRRAVAA
ncbi:MULTISPECIES: hypothetical protein [Sphingomonas]|uniref:DoxX family protein n=2 Tax=Sphingomonas TaxID=13687 RepID=A0A2A4HY23_9SPHN|nr:MULTISPECIES: hypothetical protein [Sphingomonas]NJC35328.1 hypothetical protein [Sphingomonas jejuensis]PCG09782.1 hypothetical protein COA17_08040 [Sphingomonas ginsenosidimutans]